jgi:hypothetical protein
MENLTFLQRLGSVLPYLRAEVSVMSCQESERAAGRRTLHPLGAGVAPQMEPFLRAHTEAVWSDATQMPTPRDK